MNLWSTDTWELLTAAGSDAAHPTSCCPPSWSDWTLRWPSPMIVPTQTAFAAVQGWQGAAV